jgi:hypothetical protein
MSNVCWTAYQANETVLRILCPSRMNDLAKFADAVKSKYTKSFEVGIQHFCTQLFFPVQATLDLRCGIQLASILLSELSNADERRAGNRWRPQ